jgi:putative sigma-54 modulation protein
MAVRIDIFPHNLDLTDKVRDTLTKKVGKLSRFLKNINETRVDVTYVKSARNANDRFVAQITIRGRGYILRTEERADEVLTAFDAALDKMERQVERLKGKRRRGRGDGRSAAEVVAAMVEEQAPGEAEIVRRKAFELYPMTEAEALEQMKLLSHDNFFIFFNAETDQINVLYRRRDGTYGLIEPKVS